MYPQFYCGGDHCPYINAPVRLAPPRPYSWLTILRLFVYVQKGNQIVYETVSAYVAQYLHFDYSQRWIFTLSTFLIGRCCVWSCAARNAVCRDPPFLPPPALTGLGYRALAMLALRYVSHIKR